MPDWGFAIAAFALAASTVESLRKSGLVSQQVLDELLKGAASYVQASCADYPPEIEQEAQRVLQLFTGSQLPEPQPT